MAGFNGWIGLVSYRVWWGMVVRTACNTLLAGLQLAVPLCLKFRAKNFMYFHKSVNMIHHSLKLYLNTNLNLQFLED